ncbi:MAG: Asp-tRNA(Asn)/Glu-tRNA(Gln) amidotransferase subunit GatC [Selenomonadales bacterium]|jgi:aspartyl-tRNA(Asn)/glutamyl-tRNA(Gln) amidotransferase subunit C|nr:Asp-tRNA(Asn)/Glu-tRNA(Gln) amidotransferase subunit GatC [Selenomonadales bacterium]MDY3739546.1 Asp-tRNA(Asn)/Glu-tRNA(Gln) amidotransferase subunit GatC [Selenomonadaceae bacterium]MEE1362203.1 Asp-tRNA(Asn)/Glu-tRNA(Gln) amidotransferase subunit GatC [Selenomonadaceae bacterium]
MKVTKKDLENVAVLSRLAIPADKEEQYTNQLNDVLTYMENLNSINTDDVQPIAHVLPISNVFRDDVVKESLDRDLALSNAPLKDDGYFKVPKILEG